MNIKSILLIFLVFLSPFLCRAQDLNGKVLLTVGGKKIQVGEFIRMYKKNIDQGKPQNIDEYLQQYIIFKLKVADAESQGLDTTREFRNELNGYRNQLAQNYLSDNQIKEKLLEKAYQRSLKEINAWHILVALPQDATPTDTLRAWNKALDIRQRIILGESFEQVARGTSDDQSVKINGGNLGYFTVFQMIMPFEDAVYGLKKGALSMPVRTPYGYHIIKVTDIRPAKGRIKVAHIMKTAPPGTGENEAKLAEEEIRKIYKMLEEGNSFSDLARKYSDHKESAVNGGELDWFGAGEIISGFSDAAFELSDTGSYTKPVRTIYGWHIIKLLDRKPPGSFDETRSFLESRLNQSYLNSLSKRSFVNRLKKEYKFTINKDAYDWFIANTDTLIIQGLRKYGRTTMPVENLYTFANLHFTTNEFANFIEKSGSMIVTRDSVRFINFLIETKASDQLINYENSVLEKKYPEFRYLINEFHDGILLFDISERNIWNRVSNDSVGLLRYYEDHKKDYLSRRGIEATIYTLRSPDGEKSLLSAFKRFSRKNDMDNRMIEKFNTEDDTLLIIKESEWFKGTDPEIDNLHWVTGSQSFRWGGFPSIINIKRIIEPVPLKFKEVQGEMMTGFQEYLDNEWLKQLKEKYSVMIDNLVLEELKQDKGHE